MKDKIKLGKNQKTGAVVSVFNETYLVLAQEEFVGFSIILS